MPYAKIHISSDYNIKVDTDRYVYVDPGDIEDDGTLSEDMKQAVEEEALQQYIVVGFVDLVENKGD